jgi:hypothetical protein
MEQSPSYVRPATGTELPLYVSVTEVRAARIIDVQFDPGSAYLVLDAGPDRPATTVQVSDDWLRRRVDTGRRAAEGYYVVYPNGYTSWSPADVFESRATPFSQWGIPVEQEPKYNVNYHGRIENRHTRKPIPDDEPLLIFRAKDKFAHAWALTPYCNAVIRFGDGAQAQSFTRRVDAFSDFALHHPQLVKVPT